MNQRGGELTTQMLDIYLLSMHQETLDIVPNIAAGYAVADDGLTVTLELRPGTRWSNGDPFIVDDLMFVMEDMKWDDRVDPGWRACRDAHLPVRLQPDHPDRRRAPCGSTCGTSSNVVIRGWTICTVGGRSTCAYAPRAFLERRRTWGDNQDADELMAAAGAASTPWAEALVAHWDINRRRRPGDRRRRCRA